MEQRGTRKSGKKEHGIGQQWNTRIWTQDLLMELDNLRGILAVGWNKISDSSQQLGNINS